MTLAQIKQQAMELEPAKRLRLVQDIWDSLVEEEPNSVQIPRRHKQLIDQSVAQHDSDPQSTISLAQAKTQIR